MSTTKVVIIDKQPLFRAGVKQAFAEQVDFKIIEASPDDNLAMIIEDDLPDVILLDIDTPSLNGLKIGKSLIQRYPAIRLVVMTSEINNDELFEVIRIGVAAYLDKKSNIRNWKASSAGSHAANTRLTIVCLPRLPLLNMS